jgi:hypothetical protein
MGWNDRLSEHGLYAYSPQTYRETYDKGTPDSPDRWELLEELKEKNSKDKEKEQAND